MWNIVVTNDFYERAVNGSDIGASQMFVRDRMSPRPITVSPDTSVLEALELMRKNRVRRLPVVENERLVGIVTQLDLLHVSPSPATSLSIHEINYLISKMAVKDCMATRVYVASPDDTVEKAARTMREHKVGGLPVVENGKLVGIITETNLLDAMMDMFGVNRVGMRLTIDIPDTRGSLAELTAAIRDAEADILSLATFTVSPGTGRIVVRIGIDNSDRAVAAIQSKGFQIVHKAVHTKPS